MATEANMRAVLQENALLKTKVEKLLTENQKLKTETGTLRLLIGQMRVLREREPSESSEGTSAGEEDEDVIVFDSGGAEDDVDVEMVSEMDEDNLVRENATLSLTENDQDDMGRSDDEDQGEELDDSVWKCAHCQKKIGGDRYHRLRHIIVHRQFKVSCPFEGCNEQLNPFNLKYDHIPRRHKIKHEQLSEAQEKHIRSGQVKFLAEAKMFEREFFPKQNLDEVRRLKNEICKKCGAKITSRPGKIGHVATHLKLQIVCPVRECSKQYRHVGFMRTHLREAHSELTMSQETEEEWDKAKKAYYSAVAEVKSTYF